MKPEFSVFKSRMFDTHPFLENMHSTHQVLNQSKQHLEAFFNDGPSNKIETDFLLNQLTIPYIETAIAAVPRSDEMLLKLQAHSYEKMRQLVFSRKNKEQLQTEFEAFDVANVIFSRMPRYYNDNLVSNGYSTAGNLQPPSTVGDFVSRLYEIRWVLKSLTNNQIERSREVSYRSPVLRTNAFFEIGSRLPLPHIKEKSRQDFVNEEMSA